MTTDEKLKSLIPEVTGFELNDVLLAIDNTINSWDFLIYANGTMSYKRKEFKYDLSKSIFNQEQEVKVAIINLLKDK